jgi:hypothetical protein
VLIFSVVVPDGPAGEDQKKKNVALIRMDLQK